MLPGVGSKLKNVTLDEGALKRTEAIICSMTMAERNRPGQIDGSRRRRIAAGSGTSVQEVNQLLNQFEQMKKMMKRMGRGGRPRLAFPF